MMRPGRLTTQANQREPVGVWRCRKRAESPSVTDGELGRPASGATWSAPSPRAWRVAKKVDRRGALSRVRRVPERGEWLGWATGEWRCRERAKSPSDVGAMLLSSPEVSTLQ
jgi:hypothetical protein